MEPQPADISAVQAHLDGTPAAPPAAPAPEPVAPQAPAPQQPQMQPAPVTPQPAPTSPQPLDPFSALATPPAPVAPQAPQPTEPLPNPQPQQPVEPTQPAPQTPEPIPAQSAPGEPQYQTFEEYMESVVGTVGEAPAAPDPSEINPDDPAAIKEYFDNLINTAVERAGQEVARKQAIQTSERNLWDGAFQKYGSLRENKKARDLVHSIRMGYFQRGQAITPVQAADILLDSMGNQYKQGVADSSVVTTIEQVQPQGGGSGQPVPTSLDKDQELIAVQTGGEAALADILDAKIKAGQL